jgi:hypothetical protein
VSTKSTTTVALADWHREQRDLVRSQWEERQGLYEQLDELLIRAREGGMKNGEIADALNAAVDDDLPDDLLLPDTYTPQKVTAMMRVAEAQVEWAVRMFTRDALEGGQAA